MNNIFSDNHTRRMSFYLETFGRIRYTYGAGFQTERECRLFRDENKVQEPIRKTDFYNVSDPPKLSLRRTLHKFVPLQATGLYLKKNGLILLL